MGKFKSFSNITEVRGATTVTWVNTGDIRSTKPSFEELLDREGDNGFRLGSVELRKNKEMCLYAAKHGVTIENLFNFGVLNDEIILASLESSLKERNNISFGEQVGKLMDLYAITPELFMKIVDLCEPGTEFSYEVARSSVKNRDIKSYIANNKEMAMKCIQKDPTFYRLLSPELQKDPDVNRVVNRENKVLDKDVFYALDGTPFKTMEEAAAYNETLDHPMVLKDHN